MTTTFTNLITNVKWGEYTSLEKAGEGGWERGPRGGMRRKVGDQWEYQGKDGAGTSPKADGEQAAPETPKGTDAARTKAVLSGALDKLPEGWKITDAAGVAHTKVGGKWRGADRKVRTSDAFIDHQSAGDAAKVSALKMALWAFIQRLVPGQDRHWKIKLQQKAAAAATKKIEGKPEVKPEVKPDVKPEVKPDVKPDAKPDVKPEPESPEKKQAREKVRSDFDAAAERTAKNEKPPKNLVAKKAMLYLETVTQIDNTLEQMDQSLLERLFYKGVQVGGKYVRRVPYLDAQGHRKYRYYYAESASARDVKEGEEVRLGTATVTVQKVDDNGDITLQLGNAMRTVTPDQWTKLLARYYGESYYKHAEKRARQAINAVLRHVPRALLADLKGRTEESRLEELRKQVPEVYAKLQASFQRAGVNPFRAKRIISQSLERRGWEPDARALVIGNVLTTEGAKNARHHQEIIGASENLAGGKKVEAKHVAAALELRKPRGQGDTFASKIADVAKAAERELAKLQALLKVAKGKKGATAEVAAVLAQALSATNMHQLDLLATAYPGIADRAVAPVREALLEVPSVAPRTEPKADGSIGTFYIAGDGGRPRAMRAQYKLMEAGDVIASHDVTNHFKASEKYPEGVQERAYHRDPNEQHKVRRHAEGLDPAFIINTNPDAVNGPPIVTPDNIVLGGNSRAMSVQMAYLEHPEVAAKMKAYLSDHAHQVGLTPDDVAAFKQPVLVRVVEPDDTSKEGMQLLVRGMNESFTQAMDPRTMQVAMGRRLDEVTLKTLAATMQDGETLSAYLSTPRARPFIDALHKAGVIDERNANQYMKKGTGQLNSDGKTLVSRILVGRMIDDADLLSDTRPGMVESLARSVPYMVQAQKYGAHYNLSDDLQTAISAYNVLQEKAERGTGVTLKSDMSKETFEHTKSFFKDLFGTTHPVLENERAMTLLEVLIRRPGTNQMADVFRGYSKMASHYPEGQKRLDKQDKTPQEVFRHSVVATINKEAKEEAMQAEEAARQAAVAAGKKETPAVEAGLLPGGLAEVVETATAEKRPPRTAADLKTELAAVDARYTSITNSATRGPGFTKYTRQQADSARKQMENLQGQVDRAEKREAKGALVEPAKEVPIKKVDDSPAGNLGQTVTEDDIPMRQATAAFSGTSFDPERRAEQTRKEYVSVVNNVAAELTTAAKGDPEKLALARQQLSRFVGGFKQRYMAWLDAQSRTMSTMITGGSNFPTARNNKANAVEIKRSQEMTEYVNDTTRKMLNEMNPKAISSDRPDVVVKLEEKVAELEATQARHKAINKIVRKKGVSDAEKITQLKEEIGLAEFTAKELLKPDYSGRTGIPSYEMTNNNANIRTTKERLANVQREQDKPTTETAFSGGTVVDSAENNRVQILFDEKPDAEMRTKLKSRGFRWSPSEGAWQRQRTNAARYAAQEVLRATAKAFPSTLTDLVKSFKR